MKMQSDWVQVLKQYIVDPMFGHLLTKIDFKFTWTRCECIYTFYMIRNEQIINQRYKNEIFADEFSPKRQIWDQITK